MKVGAPWNRVRREWLALKQARDRRKREKPIPASHRPVDLVDGLRKEGL